ncbi:Signal peptidase 22kDa subunit [Penicillium capsulatum]|uniref:Signal peptidase subunit 3 n=1 Tax=Penicillium capsulatum TaxID=69766 RepID=A0A9W9IS71_9EURO|nr:Signal peptidase 22kDa subunit [Penicillium capsulatum]KAJ6130344.1 Signal peptidase 22kDa subunit [Penicillium capsulatum]
MHSSLNRVQSVFGFFTTVALVVAGVAALSVLLFPTEDITASVQLKNVQVYVSMPQQVKGRPHYYSTKREEYAQLRFDLDADLTPLFHWNTKQIFVYVYAAYSSSDHAEPTARDSEIVIWDSIIPAAPSPYSFDTLSEKALALLPDQVLSYVSPTAAATRKKNERNALRAAKAAAKGKGKAKKAPEPEPEPEPGMVKLRNQRAKYQVSDITGRLVERKNVTLSVGWNVQPWVGALFWSPGTGAVPRTEGTVVRSEAFDFPALKEKKKPEAGQAAS